MYDIAVIGGGVVGGKIAELCGDDTVKIGYRRGGLRSRGRKSLPCAKLCRILQGLKET